MRYFPGLQTLVEAGYRVFIEIGPRPVLTELGRRALGAAGEWIGSVSAEKDANAHLLALARCHALGLGVDWSGVPPHAGGRRVVLPTYLFERRRYWIDPPEAPAARTATAEAAPPRDDLLNAFADLVDG